MISSVELANKEFIGISLPEPYSTALGKVPPNFSMAIWGPPGSGKSTVAVDLAYVLANILGKGIYCSSEEGAGPSMQDKIKRLKAEHADLYVKDFDGIEDLKSAIKYGKVTFCIFDSASMSHIKVTEMEDIHDFCKKNKVAFIYILHATKAGDFKGNSYLVHMPDTVIKVEDGIVKTTKNRFADTPQEFDVLFEAKERENPLDRGNEKIDLSSNEILAKYKLKTGEGYFVIAQNKNWSTDKKNQDRFKMFETTKSGAITEDWGTHPTFPGAKSFAVNKKIIEREELFIGGERLNPAGSEFSGLEYIENPADVEDEFRENKAVSPDDIYEMITNNIISVIEDEGELPWQKQYESSMYDHGMATNFVSKKAYSGINWVLLNFFKWVKIDGEKQLVEGSFSNPYFLTFNQVEKLGGKIKKGAVGQLAMYYTKLYSYQQADPELEFSTYKRDVMIDWIKNNRSQISLLQSFSAEEITDQSYYPILKYYNIFNGEDIEGIEFGKEIDTTKLSAADKIKVAEAIFSHFPGAPKVVHEEQKPFYKPENDTINMPVFGSYNEPQYYYSTLYHEAVHSTGHKKRLDRDSLHNYSKDQNRPFEELIAEMGAAYLSGEAGILFKTLHQSAAYLQGWNSALVDILEKDHKYFFRAAARAQNAADHILDRDENGIPAYRKDLGDLTEEIESTSDVLTVEDFKKDISYQLAYNAYSNSSFSPDKRAKATIDEYAQELHGIYEEFMQAEDKEAAKQEFERYHKKAKELYTDILHTQTGIASSFVVGPANFPVKKMEKRLESERKKTEKYLDFTSRVKNKVLKKLGVIEGSQDIVSGSDGAIDQLKAKTKELEDEREQIKTINKLIRKDDDEGLRELGLSDSQIEKLKEPDFAGRKGFPPYVLKNLGANIRRYKNRLEAEKKKAKRAEDGNVEIQVEGATIVENFDDNRLQIFFDSKPDKDVRDELKSNGFRWAPSKKAWQRQLTNNARHAVKRVFPELYNQDKKPKAETDTFDPTEIAIDMADYLLWQKGKQVKYDPELVVNNFFNTKEKTNYLAGLPVYKERKDSLEVYKAYKKNFDSVTPEKVIEIVKAKIKDQKAGEAALDENLESATVDIYFKTDKPVTGLYDIIEARDLIPSHNKDCSQNSKHLISKAQPRDRSGEDLCNQSKLMAQKLNPDLITVGNKAFDGAPVTLPDGQVIQGNGRSIALKIAYDEFEKQADKYRNYLLKNASKFGLTRDYVVGFTQPVLVRKVDVSESEAVKLGNIVDTSQAKMNRLDQAKAYIRQLDEQKRQIIGRIINSSSGETLGEIIDDKGLMILGQLKDLDRTGLVQNNALTSDGKDFLIPLFAGLVFDSDQNKDALKHFAKLLHNTKAGIERSYGFIIPFIGTERDVAPTLQKSIEIVQAIQNSDAIGTISDFLAQGDAFTGINKDRFSEKEVQIAEFLLPQSTQKAIKEAFQVYYFKNIGRNDLLNPVEKVSPDQAFQEAFVDQVRINPPEELVKLYTPADFKTGDIVRDYYDNVKYEMTSKRKGTYYFKNVKTGQREKFRKSDKRFLRNRDVTPTLSLFRDNPEPLAFMGITEKITIGDGNQVKELKGNFPTFLSGDKLYIIPKNRVKKVKNKVNSKKAVQDFETFHNYNASDTDYKIDFPEEKSIAVGTAQKIWYTSDKVIQEGDQKGKTNHYVHDFDAGKRPAVVKGDVLIIGNIEWDARGLLN